MSGQLTAIDFVRFVFNTSTSTLTTAANPDRVGAQIVGVVPVSAGVTLATPARAIVNADGSITLTLAANPTPSTATFDVVIARFM